MKRGAVLFAVMLMAAQVGLAQAAKQLTIKSIFAEGGLTGRAPETLQWSPDGRKVSFVQRDDSGEHGALYYVDVATGKRAVLVAEEKLATLAPPISRIKDEREKERLTRYSVAGYQWAPDSRHLLFESQGQLWLYSLETGTAVSLASSADPSSAPEFSPDGKHISYVRKHNLFVRSVSGDSETQLTKDTSENLLNGEVDWVYAEELDVRSNYFWSPDSRRIVFLQMNEEPVPTYPIVDWIPQHPKVDPQKYPKAGDPNPMVRLGIVNASGGAVKWISVGEAGADREYIPRFGWVTPETIWLQVLNRAQSRLELWFVDVSSGKSRRMLTENEPEAWVPVNDNFQVLSSGDHFLWSSWRGGHTHLYLYSFDKGNPLSSDAKLERQLTSGDFEVTGVDGVDEATGTVYFTANPGDPRQRQLFAVKLDGSGSMQQISREPGTHHATFASSAGYYVDNYSALMRPPALSLCKVGGDCARFWQARALEDSTLIAPKRLELKAADGSTTLYATLLLPPNPTGSTPLLLNPYGGPGSQSVSDAWGGPNFLFDQILAQRGFAILKVDNRGMAGRSKAFQAAARRGFGEVPLADQLAALDQVLKANPQLDANRIGWWGWSYGGYMTLYAMTHSDRIKAGIAVGPVTNWLDYDSIYTERYMGLPKENAQGYKDSSPVNMAANLKGRLLEVHGTSDDNVHLQNTMQMIHAFIEAGVPYDLQLYPRKTHGIAGSAARTHLFRRILAHFETYLGVERK